MLRMIDYRELDALAKDPRRASSTAAMLLTLQDADWNEWEADFLVNLSTWKAPLSTRQAEKLIELRDAGVLFDKIDGFSLKALIDKLWTYRDELADADFIGQLKASGAVKLRKRQALRLLAYARQVGEIERHQGWQG
jgi:endo-alpha-1,4-polygalactosaminidase (GH114 family)